VEDGRVGNDDVADPAVVAFFEHLLDSGIDFKIFSSGEGENGFDFLARIQDSALKLRCMVHSNRHLQEYKEKAESFGVETFIPKPLNIENLVMFLQRRIK